MGLAAARNMSSPIAVVTGANGYLARTLMAKLVALGVDVRGVSRSPSLSAKGVTHVHADIRDATALASSMRGADVVFHLAAHAHDVLSKDETRLQESITLGGTVAVLSAAERCGIAHFIFASSLAVYGPMGSTSANESHACKPQTPYGQAKLRAETAVAEFATRTGAHAASIRPAMIYGVGCPGNLSRMIRAIKRRTFPPIPDFGNRRSMISVDDVATVMALAWKANVRDGRRFNVTDGTSYSTRQVYDMIRQSLGRPRPTFSIPRTWFSVAARLGDAGAAVVGHRLPFDSEAMARLSGSAVFTGDRARRELGFTPTTTLPDLLPAMVRTGVSKRRH